MLQIDLSNYTAEQLRERAESWLGKAIKLEADNKPSSIINKALDVAVEAERLAVEKAA